MWQMYKVFINDKPVILTNQLPDHTDDDGVMQHLFKDKSGLKRIISLFEQDEHTKELTIINTKENNLLYDTFVSLFKPVTTSGGIVYNDQKGMLWILRHNRWDLPKGKIDNGESMEDAAIREVEEETGLKKLQIQEKLGVTWRAYREKNNFILKSSHWYKMATARPDSRLVPQTSENITAVEWVDQKTINEKISNTYASLQGLAKEFVTKYTNWELR
jgi:ADP-ribose pyrophosphatase YjhB (NUDIX family)